VLKAVAAFARKNVYERSKIFFRPLGTVVSGRLMFYRWCFLKIFFSARS